MRRIEAADDAEEIAIGLVERAKPVPPHQKLSLCAASGRPGSRPAWTKSSVIVGIGGAAQAATMSWYARAGLPPRRLQPARSIG